MKGSRLGLVLSGGGACGAYEVGVLQVLAQLGLDPQVVSGASIGALNGAIIAATPSLAQAAKRLTALWAGLTPEKLFRPKVGTSLRSIGEALLRMRAEAMSEDAPDFFALFDASPLESLLQQHINIKRLYRGRKLYISVFPGSEGPGLLGILKDLLHWVLSDRSSEFVRVQDFAPHEVLALLKASAAVPLFFQGQKIRGQVYRDGGTGDRRTAQGNTPIEPLLTAGCTHAVVISLDEDYQPEPHRYPGLQLTVIRPSKPLKQNGLVDSLLDFSPERIRQLIDLGRQDAKHCPELIKLQKELKPISSLFSRLRHLFAKD